MTTTIFGNDFHDQLILTEWAFDTAHNPDALKYIKKMDNSLLRGLLTNDIQGWNYKRYIKNEKYSLHESIMNYDRSHSSDSVFILRNNQWYEYLKDQQVLVQYTGECADLSEFLS